MLDWGIVKLTHPRRLPGIEGGGRHFTHCSCGDGCSGDLPPGLESLSHLLAVRAGWEVVASGAEVRRDRAIGGEKTLGVPGRLGVYATSVQKLSLTYYSHNCLGDSPVLFCV
jgi:hypothetical protein